MKKYTKIISLAMAAALTIGTFSACGKKAADTDDQGRTIINVGNYPTKEGQFKDNFDAKIAKFETDNPDVKVNGDQWTFDLKSFYPKAAGGQLPTVFQSNFTEASQIIASGYSADLTDVLKKYNLYDKFNKDILKIVSKDDKVYSFPFNAYALGIAYNVDLFEKAGLMEADGTPKQPKDWEEVREFAVKIKEKTGKPGFVFPSSNNAGGWMFMPLAWSYGVEFMKQGDDGKWKATFNTSECVAALQYIKDLKWKYDVLPGNALIDLTEYYKQYGTDNAGMLIAPGSAANHVSQYGMDVNKVGALAMPKGPKKHVTLLGGAIYSVSAAATEKQIDAAVRWIKMAYNPDLTEDVKTIGNADIDEKIGEGEMIGTNKLNVWNKDADSVKYLNQLNAQRANANINHVKLYNDFVADMGDCELRAEEPVCAQELYGTLDNCIQEVLTNKDADCAALLEKACSDFQKNYLDNIEF